MRGLWQLAAARTAGVDGLAALAAVPRGLSVSTEAAPCGRCLSLEVFRVVVGALHRARAHRRLSRAPRPAIGTPERIPRRAQVFLSRSICHPEHAMPCRPS